jgi:hypothetical protein
VPEGRITWTVSREHQQRYIDDHQWNRDKRYPKNLFGKMVVAVPNTHFSQRVVDLCEKLPEKRASVTASTRVG